MYFRVCCSETRSPRFPRFCSRRPRAFPQLGLGRPPPFRRAGCALSQASARHWSATLTVLGRGTEQGRGIETAERMRRDVWGSSPCVAGSPVVLFFFSVPHSVHLPTWTRRGFPENGIRAARFELRGSHARVCARPGKRARNSWSKTTQ